MQKNESKKQFEKLLKQMGFIKPKSFWYKLGEVILIISLQRSKYSKLRYFEVGINFNVELDLTQLKFYHRDIGFRLEDVFTEDERLQNSLLFDDEEKSYENLTIFFQEKGNIFLSQLLNKTQLKEMYQQGFFKNKMITNKAIEALTSNT